MKNIRTVSGALALVLCASLLASVASAASPQLVAARNCRRMVTTQGRNYAKKRLTLLLNCVDKLLNCEVQAEVDGTNQTNCRSKAKDSCNNWLAAAATSTLSKAEAVFDTKATQACLVLGLAGAQSTAPGGLWFANDATCGASPDLPTLITCLRGEIEPQVDATVAQVKPRAGILLTNIGLGDQFPNIPLPPTVTVVISATAPGSGVLVNPGTINVPVGSALEIQGDPNLSCGGGPSNGHLDVTVGAQTVQIKEPWGPSIFAILGPYTATGSLSYTISLKDSSCMDSTSGSVSVGP
jgi:hypothetical protein